MAQFGERDINDQEASKWASILCTGFVIVTILMALVATAIALGW